VGVRVYACVCLHVCVCVLMCMCCQVYPDILKNELYSYIYTMTMYADYYLY